MFVVLLGNKTPLASRYLGVLKSKTSIIKQGRPRDRPALNMESSYEL